MPQLLAAAEFDDQCVLSHALRGLLFVGIRKSAFQPVAHEAFQSAKALQEKASSRELGYIAALEHSLAGNPEGAVDCFEQILQDNPTDCLALAMVQGELFWMGDMVRSAELSTSVQSRWSAEMSGYSAYLAIRSFDLEEIGEHSEAEQLGRKSVELDRSNVWGAHAVAHVLLMQHRVDEGLAWIESLSGEWVDANQLQLHLWWHQCLFHLERGDFDAALSIHDTWLRNRDQPLIKAMPDFYLDIQNGASLLWRLETSGVDVGERWLEMSEVVLPWFKEMTSPFTSAHVALILVASGRFDAFEQLVQSMRSFANDQTGSLAQGYDIAVHVALACRMHRAGNHAGVLSTLLPYRQSLFQMGGSHAQQELFFQVMFDSARHLDSRENMTLLHRELELIGFQNMQGRAAYA